MRVFLVIVFRLVRDVVANHKPPAMRVRQRKLYKKITLLKYNVGVQAALYTKEGDLYGNKDTEPCAHKMVMQIPHSIYT